jgi:hypothetical protein
MGPQALFDCVRPRSTQEWAARLAPGAGGGARGGVSGPALIRPRHRTDHSRGGCVGHQGCGMLIRFHFPLLPVGALPVNGAPASTVAGGATMRFSELKDGIRQWDESGVNDHAVFYALVAVAAMVVLVVLLARILKKSPSRRKNIIEAPVLAEAKNIRLMCPNVRCRSLLVVPEAARGKNIQCGECKKLVKVPLVPPARTPHRPHERHGSYLTRSATSRMPPMG